MLTSKASNLPAALVAVIVIIALVLYSTPTPAVRAQVCTNFFCSFTSSLTSFFSSATSTFSSFTNSILSTYSSYSSSVTSIYSSYSSSASSFYTSATSYLSQESSSYTQWANSVSQVAATDFQQAVQMAQNQTGTYADLAWTAISNQAESTFVANYSNAQQVAILSTKMPLITEGTIAVMRLVPIYDPNTGQLVTFDTAAREWVSQNPELAGSDLANDPVATGTLMLLNSNYVYYAPLIKGPDGTWISIEQARSMDYMFTQVQQTQNDFGGAKAAYASGNSQGIETNLQAFSNDLSSINSASSSGSFLGGPTGVFVGLLVSVLLLLVLAALLARREKKRTNEGMGAPV